LRGCVIKEQGGNYASAAFGCESRCVAACLQVLVVMLRCSKNRPFSRIGGVAFIGLAFCVFMWGLQYKLSLYDSPEAASHHIPKAKLLSKNEQSSSAESPLVVRTRTSTKVIYTVPSAAFFFILSLILSIWNPPLSGQRELRASRLWHLGRPYLRTRFVRPPPPPVLA
jgi:hypothetical protein